jgi:hypothetical protein
MIELPSLETLRLFRFWVRGEDPYTTVTMHRRLWPKPKPKRKIRVVKPEKVRKLEKELRVRNESIQR